MATVEKSALVLFSAKQMYDLVNDIDRYHEFLPWCKNSKVILAETHKICGEIQISRVGIKQTFSSCNQLTPHEKIEIALLKGPFKQLEGAWQFQALKEDACKISLHLDFEFSGGLIDKAFSAVFNEIANTMVDSFSQRAKIIYA